MSQPKLFVALDLDNDTEVLSIAKDLQIEGVGFKVGPRLVNRYGSRIIKELSELGPVFVDLKFYDIPNTMLSSLQSVYEAGASYATIHALAGPEALTLTSAWEKEVQAESGFQVLAVTILTSYNEQNLPAPLMGKDISEQVQALASDCVRSGIKGLVCSAQESMLLKEQFPGAYLVTPGVRPDGTSKDDQKRVVTPAEAKAKGASAIVVGRPILNADNKAAMVKSILADFA